MSSDENEVNVEPEIISRFQQILLFKQVIKVDDAVEILSTLSKTKSTIEDVERLVLDINPQLKNYYQMVKCVRSDINGEKYLVVANIASNPFTLTIPTYSENEMKMFSLIIDELMTGQKFGEISTIDILNLSSEFMPPISKSVAEEIMKKLVREHWLHNQDGTIYFGVRSTAEMIPFLLSNYRDYISVCSRCKCVALASVSCNNENCPAILHLHCLEKFIKKDPHGYCCLSCGQKRSFN